MEDELSDLKKQLEEQKSLLVEQEHRFFKVLTNFFISRRKWPKDDKRRAASAKALLYSIFFSPTTVAVTGGTVAIISLFILYDQTDAMKEQNVAIVEQNQLLLEQNNQQDDQFVNQRLTELTKILYDTTVSEYTGKLKTEALYEYIQLKRRRTLPNQLVGLQNAQLQGVRLNKRIIEKVDFSGANFSYSSLDSMVFKNCEFENAAFLEMSLEKVYFESNNFKESESHFTTYLNVTFYKCNFELADFSGSCMKHVVFDKCVMLHTIFSDFGYDYSKIMYTKLKNVNFKNSNLAGTTFVNAYIIKCDFTSSNLEATTFNNAVLELTKINASQFCSENIRPSLFTYGDENLEYFQSIKDSCGVYFNLSNRIFHQHGELDIHNSILERNKLDGFLSPLEFSLISF